LTDDTQSLLLCDTGVLSRVYLRQPLFLEAYNTILAPKAISTSVFIELQHWLIIQRGLISNPISRADYDRYRQRLDRFIILNSDGVSEQALAIARRWPDTGVGDCYTIATALVFDVPVFTLNPKHIERVRGLSLHKPDNYAELLRSVRRT
jgi:predicted nucleic acid-binding protein